MADARLTTIAGEVKTLIDSMTVVGGYHYDWSELNETDAAQRTAWPSAVIRYKTCDADSSSINALYGFANAEFTIECDYKITPSTTDKPEFTADGKLDSAFADLMKLFTQNNTGLLPLSKEAVITFKNSEKVDNKNQSTYRPTKLVTKWNVFYHVLS